MSSSSHNGDRPNGPETGPAGPRPEPAEPNPNNNNGYDQTHGHHSAPPQPAMGYPPVMGYPPGGHPPPGPYPPNYNPYPYPPAPGYYPNPNPYQQQQHHPVYMHPAQGSVPRRSPVEGFIRGVVTAVLILIILSCFLSIITFIFFRPMLPDYHLTSFSVTGFHISDGVLAGNWDATLSVHNPNPNQRASFDRTKAYVYHGNRVNYLSSSMVQPMSLGKNATSSIQVRNTMANQVQPPEGMVADMGEERGGGSVKFQMALTMLATFKSEMGWITHLSMMVYCDDLTVRFPNATAGSGSVDSSDLPRRCMILA